VTLDHLGKLDPIAQGHPSRQIAAKLREAIHAGRFAPGAKLPSQPELAAHFRVARETVKRALDQLRTERLIMTRQGAGAFVLTEATADEGLNLLDNGTPGDLDLRVETGGVTLKRRVGERGAFYLGVDGDAGFSLARLDRADLLVIIAHAAKLLAEDEVG
jgi:DNA-binding GntR family transcriptional regulator